MNKFGLSLLVTLTLLLAAGCSSMDSKTRNLKLGMSRAMVVDILGDDYTVVGARKDQDGKAIEALKYEGKDERDLYLYLREDKLVQWGDQGVLANMPENKGN